MAQPIQLDAPPERVTSGLPWWRQLTGYHWFVFLVASGAWLFDCLDQRLFSLARIPALTSLKPGTPPADIQAFGKVVTAFFLIGWGIGGMIFGSLGDKYGRARMLTTTILIYSVFTGLSFFSQNWYDFTTYRFLTGLGVGGVFGLAVALIAETVPSGARTQALGLLQVLSSIGNITAGLAKMATDAMQKSDRRNSPGPIVFAKQGISVNRDMNECSAFCSTVNGCSATPRRCVCFFHCAAVYSPANCGSQNAM
jgi:hypothetical protein